MKKNNFGFSMVELIVVIAIMAVLVGILAPQFVKYIEKTKVSSDIQNFQSVKEAVESYYIEHNDDIASKKFELSVVNGRAQIVCEDKNDILKNYGLPTDIEVKSDGWINVKMNFEPSDNKWKITGTNKLDEEKYQLVTMFQTSLN